jgi:hypothetical protein
MNAERWAAPETVLEHMHRANVGCRDGQVTSLDL